MKYHITITDNENNEVVERDTNAIVGAIADGDGGCNCIVFTEQDEDAFFAAVIGSVEAAAIAVSDNADDQKTDDIKNIVYKTFLRRIGMYGESDSENGGTADVCVE